MKRLEKKKQENHDKKLKTCYDTQLEAYSFLNNALKIRKMFLLII